MITICRKRDLRPVVGAFGFVKNWIPPPLATCCLRVELRSICFPVSELDLILYSQEFMMIMGAWNSWLNRRIHHPSSSRVLSHRRLR